jgi:HAD superfamily hydrolase (TIGR01509 family)
MRLVDGAHFDWETVDTVLLDMDGTLLDLRFDNFFWKELVPQRYSESRGIGLEEAHRVLTPRFAEKQGTLEWYCLDHWSRELGMDIVRLKEEVDDYVEYLPDVPQFLISLRASGRRLALVTNAHRDTLAVKIRRTGLGSFVDVMYTSHEIGLPKEDPAFWAALRELEPFDPARTMLVDDSLPVLRSAHEYGIGRIVAIRRPDSSLPARRIDDFHSVDALPDLGTPPGTGEDENGESKG